MAMKPCATLDEFVQLYDKDMERILASWTFRKYVSLELIPDLKTECYIHLVDKKFFLTYDPTKGAFSTYLYSFLWKFLKSEKAKRDREVTKDALSIDQKIYQEGNVTLLDVVDFKTNNRSAVEGFENDDFNRELMGVLSKKLKKLKIYNPYSEKSMEGNAWAFLETPRTFSEMKDFCEVSDFGYWNPYESKKERIKHQIWEVFRNHSLVEITPENKFWAHVGGVKMCTPLPLTPSEKKVLSEVKKMLPCSYFEILLQIKSLNKKQKSLNALFDKGYLDGDDIVISNAKPFYRFNRLENMAWHLILYFQEKHSELLEFDFGKYNLNTTNPTFKLLRMILNGKTNKEIAKTYKVNASTFLKAKRSILKDVKRLSD